MNHNYDGQGKSAQRETDDSMAMLCLAVGLALTVLLVAWWVWGE